MDPNFQKISLKNRFPFRLGTTSYIIPADIIPNVEYLADKVDDIELILFESDEISNLPDHQTVERLQNLAVENDLTYTVHLPLDINLGDPDETERRKSISKCLRVIRLMESVDPFAYIIHFHGEQRSKNPAADLKRWQENLKRSVNELLKSNIASHSLCVETLDYPFELVEPIVYDYDLSICLDIGHLLLYGLPYRDYLDRYFEKTRVVHLHGIINGKDHRNISSIRKDQLSLLLSHLSCQRAGSRVVSLEIFNENDFKVSLDILKWFLP
ncbi:MAG: sugar phosphate isomerase/epimerase [Proteobacteria bacterium]|nr:sugar phosphate isomerase/epimerase [Pseudomonadota bacterium]